MSSCDIDMAPPDIYTIKFRLNLDVVSVILIEIECTYVLIIWTNFSYEWKVSFYNLHHRSIGHYFDAKITYSLIHYINHSK